eukprot:4206919-Amphidinium_carterae.1
MEVIDKNPFFGGNSTKATSGINGALTRTQREHGVQDSRALALRRSQERACSCKKQNGQKKTTDEQH